MNTEDTYEFEDQVYVNPTQSRDEQMQFVENLRATQAQNNQQIAEDTYNLGTQVPTNLGGLTSGAANPDSYWMSRYQTPQVQSQVANLVATAQASALQNILSQDQAQYQERANQAYQSYQRRQRDRQNAYYNSLLGNNGGGGGGGSNTIAPGGDFTVAGEVTEKGTGSTTKKAAKVDVGTKSPLSLGGSMITVWNKDKNSYEVIRTKDWLEQMKNTQSGNKVDLKEDYINLKR